MKNSALAFALMTALVFTAFGQQQTTGSQRPSTSKDAAQDDVVRLGVTLVQVDVVVTDKNGRQVTDLKPEEVEIYEDGRPQKITNFSYVSTTGSPPAAAPPPAARGDKVVPAVPPVSLRPEQVRRTVALVVDDLTLSFESSHWVREALKKFVAEQMQPGDLVAILRTGAGMGALQQFTADKRQLNAAIERVRWNPAGRGRISAFAPIAEDPLARLRKRTTIPGAPNQGSNSRNSNERDTGSERERDLGQEIDAFREDLFAAGTLGALNFIVRGLKDLPGRKSVVLFSDGFSLFRRDGSSARVLEALRRLADLANRASVVVYTIDARGLQVVGLTAADDTSDLSPSEVEERLQNRRAELFETQQGLNYLAQQTGGFFIRNSNDLSRGVSRVLDDQKGYYLIGYVPEETTFKAEAGRRRYHRIAVKVKRPGLRVRSRQGFYGFTDEEARPERSGAQNQLFAALASPFSSGDVPLRLTTLFSYDLREGAFVRSLLHIDARDFTFTKEADGSYKTVIDILAFTFGDNGVPVDSKGASYTLRVLPENLETFRQQGLIYNLVVPIKKPGAYQLRAAVRDAGSQKVGSANQFIEVPDVKKQRLALSGISMQGMLTDSPTPPTSAADDADAAAEAAVTQAAPALRRVLPGMKVEYSYLIFNAKPHGETKRPQLEVQTMLLRDGKPVFTGKPTAFEPPPQPDWKIIPMTGSITLSKDARPGQYVLQVIITDKLAKEKYRTATQWIDFEIVQ